MRKLNLPLPNSHLLEIHMCSCNALIALEIFHYICGCKSPARIVSGMDAMFSCIFYLCDVRMRIAINFILPRKKLVSVVSFIRGKSVKEELTVTSIIMFIIT